MGADREEFNRNIDVSQADAAMSLKTWWALVCIYPLARRLTVFIVNRTRITPNQVTFCAMGLRAITALFFWQGSRLGLIAGAVAYYLAYVCDCTDGTVARLTGKTSELGRYLDHVADLVGDVVILLVLAGSQRLLPSPMVFGMMFMHVAECYISYLCGFAISSRDQEKSSFFLFERIIRYRRWWFEKNIKSFFSFPDYTALVFVLFPLLGMPAVGLQFGFYSLLFIVLYTVLSTFVSLHTGERRFP
jgi:phosphatidylglycerophosphate synthase